MENGNGFFDDDLSAEISKEGVKLTLIARRMEVDQWQLSVTNEYGISSFWLEYFSSSQLAIEAGVKAIEEEGIEPFVDTDGFEYLFDENV